MGGWRTASGFPGSCNRRTTKAAGEMRRDPDPVVAGIFDEDPVGLAPCLNRPGDIEPRHRRLATLAVEMRGSGRRIETDLAGAEHEAPVDHPLGVRTDGGRSAVGRDDAEFGHGPG